MKKLNGLKREFSLENKKLKRDQLKNVNGGYGIKSNFVNADGCGDVDFYSGPNGTGDYQVRGWLCAG